VEDADVVGGIDAVSDLAQQTDGSFYGQSSLAAEQPVERLTFDVFHLQAKKTPSSDSP
jgi:hypothetical protein